MINQKGQLNKRQGEIYNYFRQQLYQEKEWENLKDLSPSQRKGLVEVLYKSRKLTKDEHQRILKQANQAYREEVTGQLSQLRYYKEKIGARSLSKQELIKSERFKYFFPEKGEHKEFWRRKKEFTQEWRQILDNVGKSRRIRSRQELLRIYKNLYHKSPWRIRDRFLVRTEHKGTSFNIDEIWDKYYHNNPTPHTRKYYFQALQKLLRTTTQRGERVPDEEVELDRYGNPKVKAGQVIVLDSDKPGRRWSVYKKVPSLQEIVKKEVHDEAQEQYILTEGTSLEIQTWKLKKDKALCWVEAMGLGDCKSNQGTSNWWCLFCLLYGEYHPPVLPKHCPWLYTYRPGLCGSKQHSDANKQWHFSVEGERIRDKIKGGGLGELSYRSIWEKKKN